jgi:lipoprotein-anchoring transpeptidase ErfK/SrfK
MIPMIYPVAWASTCLAASLVAALCLPSAPAAAQSYPASQYVAPPSAARGNAAPRQYMIVQQHARAEPDLGGGFIEFLFGDRSTARVAHQPRTQQPRRYDARRTVDPQDDDLQAAYPQAPYPQAEYPRAGYREIDPQFDEPQADEQQMQPRNGSRSMQASINPQEATRRGFDPRYLPQEVEYRTKEAPGTIVIDTPNKFLYLVEDNGRAKRYGVGVGRPGFTWSGSHTVTAKKEWPDWRPPKEMLARQPYLPAFMAGGPENPLGARAMYLGSTLYRIHGSNEPWTIGRNVSSGCIRMRNEDVVDLYQRVKVGTKVVVM